MIYRGAEEGASTFAKIRSRGLLRSKLFASYAGSMKSFSLAAVLRCIQDIEKCRGVFCFEKRRDCNLLLKLLIATSL